MDSTSYTYTWSKPCKVCVAADDRDARQKNRKRQVEAKAREAPPAAAAAAAVAAAPAQADEADFEAVEVVVQYVKPLTSQPALRKALVECGIGRDLPVATYGILRGCGLTPEQAAPVFAGVVAYREAELKKLSWETLLADVPGATVDTALALDAIIEVRHMGLLDAQMLLDVGVPAKYHARVLDKVKQFKRRLQ